MTETYKTEISSITTGPRQSNIELLRIFAMLLVLIVHATFFTTGAPNINDFATSPVSSFTKAFFQSISIVCVNVFILISGWFGIRPSVKGFCNFLFQCFFLLISLYAVSMLMGWSTLSFNGVKECLCMTTRSWFICAYAGLYILSPTLNAFAEKSTKQQFKVMLVSFFILQTFWGGSGSSGRFFLSGYSTISFIGLYLLARYIRIYTSDGIRINKYGIWIYIISVIGCTVGYYVCITNGIPKDIYAYSSPLVITGALGLLLFFNGLHIKPNRYINFVAKSSFAVYLLHLNSNTLPFFQNCILRIYTSTSGIKCLALGTVNS